ncbi:uncharacterized protein [Eurosta solidaginis]|uniref:uncharacterized protein isoform X1 n=1 Tax=Eurosta solidaginis TaxID=178769 RepID=UPI00353117AE
MQCTTSASLNACLIKPKYWMRRANLEKFEDVIDTYIADNEELATVVKDSFPTCAEHIDEIKDEVLENMREHMEKHGSHRACSPFAAMMWRCMKVETYKNCPASVWNDTEECNAIRDFMTECSPSY